MSGFTDCMKFIALAMVFLLKLNGFGWLAQISKAFVFLKMLFFQLYFLCSLLSSTTLPEPLLSELLYFCSLVFSVCPSMQVLCRLSPI